MVEVVIFNIKVLPFKTSSQRYICASCGHVYHERFAKNHGFDWQNLEECNFLLNCGISRRSHFTPAISTSGVDFINTYFLKNVFCTNANIDELFDTQLRIFEVKMFIL